MHVRDRRRQAGILGSIASAAAAAALLALAILAILTSGCASPLGGGRDVQGDEVTRAAIEQTPSQINSLIRGGEQVVEGATHAEDNEGTLSNVFEQYGNGDNSPEGVLCWRSIAVNGAQSQEGSEMSLTADPDTCTVTQINFGRTAVSRQYDPAEMTELLNERDAQVQETIRALQDKIDAIPSSSRLEALLESRGEDSPESGGE